MLFIQEIVLDKSKDPVLQSQNVGSASERIKRLEKKSMPLQKTSSDEFFSVPLASLLVNEMVTISYPGWEGVLPALSQD